MHIWVAIKWNLTSSFVSAAVVRSSMMEVTTDTSTAWVSAVLEVMLAKSVAACSGDVLSSFVRMYACTFRYTTEELKFELMICLEY